MVAILGPLQFDGFRGLAGQEAGIDRPADGSLDRLLELFYLSGHGARLSRRRERVTESLDKGVIFLSKSSDLSGHSQ